TQAPKHQSTKHRSTKHRSTKHRSTEAPLRRSPMPPTAMPSADIVFDTLFAYQRSAALKSAIDLEVFTAIDEGDVTAQAIATRSHATERGVRILCDYLTVLGLLEKADDHYQLTPEASA